MAETKLANAASGAKDALLQELEEARARVRESRGRNQRTPTERCVYVLPVSLIIRVLNYQAACGIASEVSAVRELLQRALDAWDATQLAVNNSITEEPTQ